MKRTPICGIYIITNLINNKHYIGKSVNCLNRFNSHKHKLRQNKHYNTYLQLAWNKYGENNFSFEILEEHDVNFINSMENYWCNILNTHNNKYGYNMQPTVPFGTNSNSIEIRNKISIAHKGKIISEETRKRMSVSFRGRIMSLDTIEKIKNNSTTKKGVDIYLYNGEFIKSYRSISECSRDLNISHRTIASALKNKFHLIKNYKYICKPKGELLTTEEIEYRNNKSTNAKKIKVIGYDENGDLIGEFLSSYEAEKITGISSRAIRNCIYGKQKNVNKTTWFKL